MYNFVHSYFPLFVHSYITINTFLKILILITIYKYLFPLLRYRSRWSELTKEDFTYLFKTDQNFYNGYQLKVGVKPATIEQAKKQGNYTFQAKPLKYLEKITKLCKENNIELILIKAPSLYPYWYDEYDEQIEEFSYHNNLTYINFLDYIEEIGLDYDKDTYDMGYHLNVYGAEKLTNYFGEYLNNNYRLKDMRNNEKINKYYEKQLKKYYNDLEREKQNYEKNN